MAKKVKAAREHELLRVEEARKQQDKKLKEERELELQRITEEEKERRQVAVALKVDLILGSRYYFYGTAIHIILIVYGLEEMELIS